jgi:hypothetical protein
MTPVRPLLTAEPPSPEKSEHDASPGWRGISFPHLICYFDLAARNIAVMILMAGRFPALGSRGIVLLPVIKRSQRQHKWCMRFVDNFYKLGVR